MNEHHDIPADLPDWARPEGYQPAADAPIPDPQVNAPAVSQATPEPAAPSTDEPALATSVQERAGLSDEPGTSLEERKEELLEALKDVVDPELMVNIVDLGLVYGIDVDDENNVTIDMTLTSPACPLTDQIEMGAHDALNGLANSVTVNWVWLPAWSLERITPDGREQLRYIGYNV